MNPRQKVTITFDPAQPDRVLASLAQLCEAGAGWMNLLPGVVEEAAEPEAGAGLFAIFGTRQAPVTMATLMPPKVDRRSTEGITLGLLHPTGPKAVPRLRDAGIALPEGWKVRQDHARRGLVVRTPVDEDPAAVVAWAVAAGTELCRAPMTGSWQAVVYLP